MEEKLFQIKRFAGFVIGAIGIATALISGFDLVTFFIADQTTLSWIANVYVLALTFVAISWLGFRQFQTIRKERYANIASHLHMISHYLRDVTTFLRESRPADGASPNEWEQYIKNAKRKLVQVLDESADIFRSITSTHCRSGIKLLYPHNGDLYFYTFARDRSSEEKCRQMDNDRVASNHDPLNENTRFARVFSEKEYYWHYISNNLAKDPEFETTSMTAYQPNHARGIKSGWAHFWHSRWPLPYRSTMSCVIRQGACDLMEKRESKVLGFLTMDSESRNVFVERWDIQIMFMIADALFQPLEMVISAQQALEDAKKAQGA